MGKHVTIAKHMILINIDYQIRAMGSKIVSGRAIWPIFKVVVTIKPYNRGWVRKGLS